MREGFDEPELGFIIAREAQRKGYCMEACGAILEYGFRELGFERVQALAAEEEWRFSGCMPEIGRAEEWKHRMGGQKLCTVRMEQVTGSGC